MRPRRRRPTTSVARAQLGAVFHVQPTEISHAAIHPPFVASLRRLTHRQPRTPTKRLDGSAVPRRLARVLLVPLQEEVVQAPRRDLDGQLVAGAPPPDASRTDLEFAHLLPRAVAEDDTHRAAALRLLDQPNSASLSDTNALLNSISFRLFVLGFAMVVSSLTSVAGTESKGRLAGRGAGVNIVFAVSGWK